MREARLIMGMPIQIEIVSASHPAPGALEGAQEQRGTRSDADARDALEDAFAYFTEIDERFSPYKEDSEVSRLNRGALAREALSDDFKEVLALAEQAKRETHGYFDIKRPDGRTDPSGVVKGWAIRQAAARVRARGFEHFSVNAGGDIAVSGKNADGDDWSVGIENPFNRTEIVKVVYPRGKGMATSGSYIRGAHIYDPHEPSRALDEVKSITVIGPDVCAADIFATAAFAMGKEGVAFIESLPGFEAYQIDATMTATMTSGFAAYTS